MITTTYKCDRCGHEQPTHSQMWNVGVACDHWNGRSAFPRSVAMWCRACVDALCLINEPPPPKAGEPPVVEPSLEDKLREIIRTIVQEEMPG